MNADLKTKQTLNLLLQPRHTRAELKGSPEWRLSWRMWLMKCCCIAASLHSSRASSSQPASLIS